MKLPRVVTVLSFDVNWIATTGGQKSEIMSLNTLNNN